MKIAGHLVMVMLIKGYWKDLISHGQCSSSCRQKMKKTHNEFVPVPVLCCSTITTVPTTCIVLQKHQKIKSAKRLTLDLSMFAEPRLNVFSSYVGWQTAKKDTTCNGLWILAVRHVRRINSASESIRSVPASLRPRSAVTSPSTGVLRSTVTSTAI